ncbi:hypothetical protein [Pseudomonas koreensis]|jgi:hypothetical protein|uniref:hypothetical protein n=1 Tax=Pseudomonas koreensis TaxID=198620 RepID=UPI001B334C97|nr:hypothetical protein [Pseudomonas koreensis]MBP3998298.1 hypothetical protein [Pseudomonas koreensis]
MSMKMIRQTHGVPAKRGQRVRFTLEGSAPRLGTIRSADGGTLYVQLDGDGFTRGLHPTLGLEYLCS